MLRKVDVVVTSPSSRRPEAPLHGERVVVRRATLDDVDLLVRWHADPDVARFWDGKTYSREQILARLARPHVHAYIVEADGEPVGYLQAWFGETADTGGLDMFLIPPLAGKASALTPPVRSPGTCLMREGDSASRSIRTSERAGCSWLAEARAFGSVEEREPDDEHPYARMFDAVRAGS